MGCSTNTMEYEAIIDGLELELQIPVASLAIMAVPVDSHTAMRRIPCEEGGTKSLLQKLLTQFE